MGAAVLDLEKGMVIMTVTALSLMVVGGFFVRNVPSWLLWLGYLSPFKYSYNSSVQLIFDKPVPCDGSGVLISCNGGSEGYATETEVLDFLGVQFTAGQNAALLLAMFIVIRIMAFFALKSKKPEERTWSCDTHFHHWIRVEPLFRHKFSIPRQGAKRVLYLLTSTLISLHVQVTHQATKT